MRHYHNRRLDNRFNEISLLNHIFLPQILSIIQFIYVSWENNQYIMINNIIKFKYLHTRDRRKWYEMRSYFPGFFRDNGERVCGARYEVQYHMDGRPCRIWRDGSPREYQQWCIRAVCVPVCVCISMHTRLPSSPSARESRKEPFLKRPAVVREIYDRP